MQKVEIVPVIDCEHKTYSQIGSLAIFSSNWVSSEKEKTDNSQI